ncbi:hypothetical protein [Flavobacterium caeni]|uniref:Uncharacterized protein n=1 Tax=Flavobacterium caeni TaxID=490189 RepID=A0A1G5K216_9FLAO|nr:hypothetical protein [Flavobacterium caeni]SCY94504.1 hypothetical protein SAMN02927903_03032 [Flavobacterium caeni]
MKRLLLCAILIAAMTSCSKDETTTYIPVAAEQGTCEIRLYSIGTNFSSGTPVHEAGYGTDNQNLIFQVLTDEQYTFYSQRFNAGNYEWIGTMGI